MSLENTRVGWPRLPNRSPIPATALVAHGQGLRKVRSSTIQQKIRFQGNRLW